MNMPVNHGRVRPPRITAYTDWLGRQRGLHFGSYDELWRWSVTELRIGISVLPDYLWAPNALLSA